MYSLWPRVCHFWALLDGVSTRTQTQAWPRQSPSPHFKLPPRICEGRFCLEILPLLEHLYSWEVTLLLFPPFFKVLFPNFFQVETMEGDEMPTCEHCKARRKCLKWYSVEKWPSILVIHLKRFAPVGSYRAKLSHLVETPVKNLDVRLVYC